MLLLPSSRFFILMLLGAILLSSEPLIGLAVDVGILLLWALDAALTFRLGPPEIELEAPGRMGQGQEGEAVLHISNRSGRRVEMRLALDVAESMAGEGSSDARKVALQPGDRAAIEFPLLARVRGRYLVSLAHFRLLGPLRLAWRQGRRRLDHTIDVIPGLKEMGSYRLLALHHHLHQVGFRNVRQKGEGGAFESLREYVRGDDPRHMDWKVSARRATLMVRQYEAERSQNLVLCIDSGRLMLEKFGERERLDHALAAAIVLNEVARIWNDHVGVFAFSDRVHVFLPPGRYPPQRVPEILAKLESRNVEPDYPRALMRLSRTVARRSLLVFFSDVIDEEVSAPLATHLARLARRHLPLFIALRNSDLFTASSAPAGTRKAVYRRAGATELVLARTRTLAKMREHGIRVADVPPDGAVAAAVNRYIEIKLRGAL